MVTYASQLFTMPVALVLGGSGFVGSHVVRALVERHYTRVHVLCRPGTKLVGPLLSQAQRIEGDLSMRSILTAIELCKATLVINCAGLYAWWAPDPASFRLVNVDAVRNLMAAVKEINLSTHRVDKVVHVSTVLAYGTPAGRGLTPETAFDEDTPVGPHASQYAASKHAGDAVAQKAFASGDVPGCTVFLACCIGADPKLVDPARDVMRIKELISGAVPAVISSETTFTYVHVRDAAEAIVRAAERGGNERGGRYLVGDQRLRTGEYYDLLARLSGQPRPAREVPGWLALGAGRVASWVATRVTGAMPTAPADLVRTATAGTLLFDARRSVRELGMTYTPIQTAFAEAVDFITSHGLPDIPADQPEAMRGLLSDDD